MPGAERLLADLDGALELLVRDVLDASKVTLLPQHHVEVEGVLDALVVVALYDLAQAADGVGLLNDLPLQQGRALVLALELAEAERRGTSSHDFVVQGDHQFLFLLSFLLASGQLLAEKVNRCLCRPVEE